MSDSVSAVAELHVRGAPAVVWSARFPWWSGRLRGGLLESRGFALGSRGVHVAHDPAPSILVNGFVWQQVLHARLGAVGALNASLQIVEIQVLVPPAQVRLCFSAAEAGDFASGQELQNGLSGWNGSFAGIVHVVTVCFHAVDQAPPYAVPATVPELIVGMVRPASAGRPGATTRAGALPGYSGTRTVSTT